MKHIRLSLIALIALAGCAITRPPDHQEVFSSVAFSPDHSLLAFADAAEIRVLSVESRSLVNILRQLPRDTNEANPVNFRHGVGDTMVFLDDQRMATTGMGGLVSIWDVHSGRRLSVIDPPAAGVFASTLDYSQSTRRLVIGTGSGEILLSDVSGDVAGPLLPLAKLEGYVWDLQFGQEGRYFASASMTANNGANTYGDKTAINPAAGQISEGSGPDAQGQNIRPANLSNVAIWDTEALEKVGDLDGADEVYRMAMVPEERTLLTAGEEVRVWEFLTLEQAGEISDPSMIMQGIGVGTLVAVSVIGLAAGAAVGAPLMAFDPMTATQLLLMPVGLAFRPEACIRSVAVSPDGKTVVSTTRGPSHNVMAVIDRASGKVIDKWTAATYVCDMEFSPNGKHLLTATDSGVLIYDTTDWSKVNLRNIGSRK
jgi:WD40 repeat protein